MMQVIRQFFWIFSRKFQLVPTPMNIQLQTLQDLRVKKGRAGTGNTLCRKVLLTVITQCILICFM